MNRIPFTPEGLERAREELRHLKSHERPAIIDAVATARAHGDLSENAEYSSAREKQAFIEGRIRDLEGKVGRAEVIDPASIGKDKVRFGCVVTLVNVDSHEEKRYQIVGEYEADIGIGLISVIAPLARAMIGKEEGDTFTFTTPSGEQEYEILSIT